MRKSLLLLLALLLTGGALAGADQPSLQAEKTLKYRTGSPTTLDVRVGPVKVSSVKVTTGGSGGIGATLKAKMTNVDPETQATLQFAFDAENPEKVAWKVTYTIEFLDAKGEVIDRFTSKATYEGEAKTSSFDHVILKAALPLIDRVRIKMQAALD